MSNDVRSVSAPPGAGPNNSNAAAHSPDHDDTHSIAGSVPSTLYARCSASVSRSLNARRLRQAAENDVLFLQNRLNKLKLEEQKAKAEIDKLRKKTDEVSANRERHNATSSQRRQLLDQVDYGKRKEAALIALNKERQAKAVWSSKQKIMLEKREAVLSMRKQKEINECRIHITKEEQRDRNTRQRESIRQLHDMAKERRERETESKREEVRELHEARIEAEQQERIRKEKLAAQLVAQEAQIIYRLKKLHQEKHMALRELASSVEAGYAEQSSIERSRMDDHHQSATGSRPGSRADHHTLPPLH